MNPYRRLAVTAAVAFVSVGAAVALVATGPHDAEPFAAQTPTSPGAVWTLDAADVLGNPFATFDDPVGGRFGEVEGGVIDADDILVAKAGLINQETDEFEQSQLIGFDAATGLVRWKTPADGIESCSSHVLDTLLLCRSTDQIVTIDSATGTATRHDTDWNIFSVGTDGEDLYVVEGENDGYTVRIHRGTIDDPDASWSLTLDDTWVDPYNSREILAFAGNAGVARFSSGTALFDSRSGDITDNISSPDCARDQFDRGDQIYVLAGRRCSDLFEFRTDLVDSTGRVVATTDEEVYQRTTVDAPNDPDDPVVLGSSAFDPTTGQKLWTSDDAGTGGDIAIVGDVVLGIGPLARNLFTGDPAWGPDVESLPFMPTAVREGLAYVADSREILAIEPETGARLETIAIEDLLGNTGGRSERVALLATGGGVVAVNEKRMNLLR
ncbi:PQQ-binding-like beta-propeller repeat protein [Rhodococcus sp. IEGM 1370]|uniref:PQQ-binding-like beta-propeller repeat protein n=1 Tax=Rhodococcus sp. IEGM 1370 TaxID=3082222 RepID=UPI002954C62A|nr:PQQ-binding-like beta-propeller repeat protein [Rhodococcus sp. IEGM 1370]MDV8075239.1 PQQ-binding-like beta-propeller repeat protein [Rhodococcus sp. IEGM 1370]